MRIDEPVDLGRHGTRVAALLAATAATRYTAESDVGPALAGFAFWMLAYFACWQVRVALLAGRGGGVTPQKAGEVVAVIGMLMFLVTLLTQGILPALMAILFALIAATLLIAERRGHVLLLLGASLAAVLFAASQSRSSLFVPCAAWYTIAALSLLGFDFATARARSAAAAPIEARPHGRGGALAALLVLGLALPLYLYVPQPPALSLGGRTAQSAEDYGDEDPATRRERARDSERDSERGEPGESGARGSEGAQESNDDADSLAISEVRRSGAMGNQVVMYVKTSHPVYLRGKLFDRFDGERWFRTGPEPSRRKLSSGYLRLARPASGGTDVRQTIDIVANLDASLYASPGAHQLRFPGPVLYDHGDGTFEVPKPLRANTTYSVDAEPGLVQGRYVVAGPAPDARHLQLDDRVTERVRALAQSASAGASDPWRKALALERHLRGHYAYSYETIVPYQGRTPLDWFLFEHKRGHCEFFASAMVVMLREVGIPARLATGYSLGERNPLTGFHEVRALDGHAWAEGWIPERGWVMFEATPFYPLPQPSEQEQVASATDRYLERQADTSAVLAPESARAALARTARDAWAALRHLQLRATAWLKQMLPWLPLLAVGGFVIWALARLLGLALEDAWERRRVERLLAVARRDPAAGTMSLAEALECALASRGLAREPHATWREFCARLEQVSGFPALPGDFAEHFDDVRYGALAGVPPPQTLARLGATISAAVASDRNPRLTRQLRAWSRFVRRLFQRSRPD